MLDCEVRITTYINLVAGKDLLLNEGRCCPPFVDHFLHHLIEQIQ